VQFTSKPDVLQQETSSVRDEKGHVRGKDLRAAEDKEVAGKQTCRARSV
jgi:hypothetical protein